MPKLKKHSLVMSYDELRELIYERLMDEDDDIELYGMVMNVQADNNLETIVINHISCKEEIL